MPDKHRVLSSITGTTHTPIVFLAQYAYMISDPKESVMPEQCDLKVCPAGPDDLKYYTYLL